MKTSTLILLGIGGYVLYHALKKTATVTLPAPAAPMLLTAGNTPAQNAQALEAVLGTAAPRGPLN